MDLWDVPPSGVDEAEKGSDLARLADKATAGDQEGIDRFVQELYSLFDRRLARYGVPPEERQDLAQDCVLLIVNRLQEFDPSKGEIEAWANGFAKILVRRWHQQKTTQRLREVGAEETAEMPVTFPFRIEADVLTQALRNLGLIDRELLHMRFVLQMTSEEIAANTDMNAAQVRKRISRAVERLRTDPGIRNYLHL